MFNELKVVKYFKEITDCKILERNHETFQERVFKTQGNIQNSMERPTLRFFVNQLNGLVFSQKTPSQMFD